MDQSVNLITQEVFEQILEVWKRGQDLPTALHPSRFRPHRDVHPFWFRPDGKTAQLRGQYHEELLIYVLQRAMRENPDSWLVGVESTPVMGKRDELGIDLTLYTHYGKIQLQVKSSLKRKESFLYKRNCFCLKPIPCVVVNTDISDEQIMHRFVQEVQPYLLEKKRAKEKWDAAQQAHAP